jgi:3-dehydroquinate synthase
MKKCRVKTANAYPIYIGENLIKKLPSLLKNFSSKTAFVIADKKLTAPRKLLLKTLRSAGWKISEIPVKGGESLKDFKAIYPIYGELIRLNAKRDSVLIALGGGSVGDAAGFIAATYLRGISWVGIPTTLLAQVDSSIGGKTGINHVKGKNLIGAFHQPSLVICDLTVLKTLSDREIISGLGEALKYGLIYDANFFTYFKNNWNNALNLKPDVLERIVFQSLNFKSAIVSRDERDLIGIREHLNFGHTFGHGLEAITKFKKFQHGEAVIWGMRFASALSLLRGRLSERDFLKIDGFLKHIPVPKLRTLNKNKLFETMKSDKKVRDGRINFVLLRKIGAAVSDNKVALQDLRRAWYLIGDSK